MESTNDKSTTKISKNYCIAIDGSECSDWAFNLVLNELYQKGDKIIVAHIANPSKSPEIPFAFQPETIISKYDAMLTGLLPKADYTIIRQDRFANNQHALVQVNQIALANNCTVLVMGYKGHKVTKQKNDELTKGVRYIMSDVKIPVIIVKEKIERKAKDNSAFTWLTSIEKDNSRSFKAFQFAVDYINTEKDKVIGSHISFYEDSLGRDIKNLFENVCEKKGVKNHTFRIIEKEREFDVGTQLSNLVNYNDKEVIDFIVLGHNPGKYNKDGSESSPLHNVILTAKCNILFYS